MIPESNIFQERVRTQKHLMLPQNGLQKITSCG